MGAAVSLVGVAVSWGVVAVSWVGEAVSSWQAAWGVEGGAGA